MIFDHKPTSRITAEEVDAAVQGKIPEDAFLDYKARPYPHDAAGVHELLKDVSAFANAQGGYLIIGVGPDGSDPRLPGGYVSVTDAERERQWMIDHCLEKIEPRLPDLDIRSLEVRNSIVLLCRVPESGQKPHCARPDREHHYFWRRYDDDNRLMSVAEIRESLEGGGALREIAALIRRLADAESRAVAAHEAQQPVDESTILDLQTLEGFRTQAEALFLSHIGSTAYYRLTATPALMNALNLRDRRHRVATLLQNPPSIRSDPWNLTPSLCGQITQTAWGLAYSETRYRHLRVLWNGHIEFWTQVDGIDFFPETLQGSRPSRFMDPRALFEPVLSFLRVVQELARIADYADEYVFGLGLFNVHGYYIAPYAPGTLEYGRARADADQPWGPKPFASDHLRVDNVRARPAELQGTVPWQLISPVYYRFTYADDQIPYFDSDHRCLIGAPSPGGRA